MENNTTLSFNQSLTPPGISLYLLALLPVKLSLGLINVTFNILIIFIVLIVIKTKTFSNLLFMSTAVSDCILGFLSIPFMTLFTTYGYWPLGKTACIFWVINDFSNGNYTALKNNTFYLALLYYLRKHKHLQLFNNCHS